MIRSSEGSVGKWGEWWHYWYDSVDGYSNIALRSHDLDHVGYSPLWSSHARGRVVQALQSYGKRTTIYILSILGNNHCFLRAHVKSLEKRLSKNGNEANCVEPRHATPLFGAQCHCIWNNFDRIKVSDLPSTPKKVKTSLVSSLVSSKYHPWFLPKPSKKRSNVQTRDHSISGAYFPESRSLPHAEVFIDAPNLRLWDLWLSIGFSIWGAAIHFVHGPSKQIRFFDWLNQI